MAFQLPAISSDDFAAGYRRPDSRTSCGSGASSALYAHYLELRRWNERLG